MRTIFAVLTVVVLSLCFALPGLLAQPKAPEPFELKYFPEKLVPFAHDKHAELQCQKCHHVWDGQSEMQRCSTAGCHDVFDSKDKSVNSFYNIVHGRGSAEVASCVGCHKEAAGADKEKRKQLTGCKGSGCHAE